MKVYVFPADVSGCGYYRLIWPTRVLQAAGHDVQLVYPHQRHGLIKAEVDVKTGHPVGVIVPDDADVLVFQRITHITLARAIPLIRAQGKAVVIDIDDDLSRIHPSNPAFHAMHPKNVQLGISEHSWAACEMACRNSTVAQVSTPALIQRYAPTRDRVSVLKNYIPESYLGVRHHDSNVVGYGGALHSHSNDVPELGNSIRRLQSNGYDFMTIGEMPKTELVLGLQRPTIPLGPVPITEWAGTLTKIGIGVAPLADTQFNQAKSWLKMLEMAAVGVPCIGSPRAEYKALHKLGVGLLANDPKDWYRTLQSLITDGMKRRDLAAAGREVACRLTIEQNAYQWLETWKMAYEMEQVGLPDMLTGATRTR
jgi:glycosyltransferase involved in cell wall biosynthesis